MSEREGEAGREKQSERRATERDREGGRERERESLLGTIFQ